MEERLGTMERSFDQRFREVLGHFEELYRRLERLEQEYHAIVQALRRIEGGLSDERGRRDVLERSVEVLKQHVAALQTRIEDLERRVHQ
jgi:chromosome segregation ATPase